MKFKYFVFGPVIGALTPVLLVSIWCGTSAYFSGVPSWNMDCAPSSSGRPAGFAAALEYAIGGPILLIVFTLPYSLMVLIAGSGVGLFFAWLLSLRTKTVSASNL